MNIIDYIPQGHDNAITRADLCGATGLPDRVVRELISRARRDNCILNNQDGNGYYLPIDERDNDRVRDWLRQEIARAKSIFWSARGARKFLRGGGNAK